MLYLAREEIYKVLILNNNELYTPCPKEVQKVAIIVDKYLYYTLPKKRYKKF